MRGECEKMSRIGKKPVEIPAGVTVTVDDSRVTAKGPQGELSMVLPVPITVSVNGNQVAVLRPDDTRTNRSLHGLSRSLIANMLTGVAKGYVKELELEGVGFKADLQEDKLSLLLGFSAPVEYVTPKGIKLEIKGKVITVSGPDKQQVGNVAARIRSFYPPEPYKGKGIRHKGEHVRRKAGKTVAT